MNEAEAKPETPEEGASDGGSGDGTIEEQLEKARETAQRFEENWKRAAADLQNYKRRAEQERDEARRFASESVVRNLLPVLDDFERAFATLDGSLRNMTWFDGIALIYRKLEILLTNVGVKPIEALGKPFDPNVHEAVQHIDGEEGKVLAEIQRGYTMGDRVLRPAMVVVGKGAQKDEEPKSEETPDERKEDRPSE